MATEAASTVDHYLEAGHSRAVCGARTTTGWGPRLFALRHRECPRCRKRLADREARAIVQRALQEAREKARADLVAELTELAAELGVGGA